MTARKDTRHLPKSMATSDDQSAIAVSCGDQLATEQVLQPDARLHLKSDLLMVVPLPQVKSPLYCKISGEIRTRIFMLALREFEDKTKPYRPNRVYYRPGFHYHTKQDTRLLQTCRLVYQEARMMPVALKEFVYWVYGGPANYFHHRYAGRLDLFMDMTVEQIEAIDTIHLFAQQDSLEKCSPFMVATVVCKKFKITIRHSDWWSWESPVGSEDRLAICPWRSGRITSQEMQDEPLDPDLQQRYVRLSYIDNVAE